MIRNAESLIRGSELEKQKMCVVDRRVDEQRIAEWKQTPNTRLFEDDCSTLSAAPQHFFIARRRKRSIDEGLGCSSPGPEP